MEKATLIYNPCFADNRGVFAPLPLVFGEDKIEILRKDWVQSNISYNPNKFTFRGMHLQEGPYAQAKLVKVVNGSIIDFVVDLRPKSPDYLKVQEFIVTSGSEVYVPRGFAHGFITTEDNTVVQYLVDNQYNKESERSILWSSFPEIRKLIKEQHVDPIISDKDLNATPIHDYLLEPKLIFDTVHWQGRNDKNLYNSNIAVVWAGSLMLLVLLCLAILNFLK
jgi:dTDP-4-dehydrorhamnose 3,5-epimerase